MDLTALMGAVEETIRSRYPKDPIYVDRLGKNFRRPSFGLELLTEEWRPLNIGLVQREAAVLVTCFVEVNGYHDSSRIELTRRQETVQSLFAPGFLRVEDRAIQVEAQTGEGDPDFALVTLRFRWVDSRPDSGAEQDAPLMEHIEINQGRKE